MKNLYVKAEVWDVRITDSVVAMFHGSYKNITEIYVPKYGISFNYVNDQVNAFKTYDTRYSRESAKKIKNTKILKEMAETIFKYVQLRDAMYDGVKEYVDQFKLVKK